MEWYWWVLIVLVIVLLGYLKIKLFNNINKSKKDHHQDDD